MRKQATGTSAIPREQEILRSFEHTASSDSWGRVKDTSPHDLLAGLVFAGQTLDIIGRNIHLGIYWPPNI